MPGAFVFVLGAVIGSFLNVCIYRIPAGESVVRPASRCPACGQELSWFDLIPILSFLFLRGRCRYCGARISWQYPAVEAAAGLLFLLVWIYLRWPWEVMAGWVFAAVLLTVSVIDLYHQIIPDSILLAGTALGLPLIALHSFETLKWGIAAGLGGGIFMLAVAFIGSLIAGQEAMGCGDIKLTMLMGLFLGPRLLTVALLTSIMAGGLAGGILLISGRKQRSDAIPFGPYLALGALLALFWGTDIIEWYFNLWGS